MPRIAVIGAGALGAFYASRFHMIDQFETFFIAREPRFSRLQREGVVVNGQHFAIPVVAPGDQADPADLIIVALKHHHLATAVSDLKPFVAPHTTIISVMNGLDSEETIGAVYGMEKVLYAIAVGIDGVREGNRITVANPGKLFFGEAENSAPSRRVGDVQAMLDCAGLVYETPADMIRTMWWKFMINVGMNQSSAVMGAPYGVFQTSSDAQVVMEALMGEVITLAQGAGVDLTRKDIDDWYGFLKTLSPDGKTSMLQDIEAGRKTEVELFGEKVVALGQEQGVPTPVNETLLRLIRVMEQVGR